MSLRTWLNEFYPISAADVPIEMALAHSIRKWEGLQPHNMERHGVCLTDNHEVTNIQPVAEEEPAYLSINSSSCALCCHHAGSACLGCPLVLVLNGHGRCDYGPGSPWGKFASRHDADTMLRTLRSAMEAMLVLGLTPPQTIEEFREWQQRF